MSMLETQALTREFGGVIAVNKVDFFVEKNMITGLIYFLRFIRNNSYAFQQHYRSRYSYKRKSLLRGKRDHRYSC